MSLDSQSSVFDEICYPPAGYDYLTTARIRLGVEHPPIAKALSALPLFFLKISPPQPSETDQQGFGAGWDFFFRNTEPARRLLFYSRLPSIAAGLALAWVLFLWAQKSFGLQAALFALVFFLSEPMFRALSGLAVHDIFLACFFTTALYFLDPGKNGKASRRNLILSGFFGALAALSKFSGFLFIPVAFTLLSLCEGWRRALKKILLLTAIISCCFILVYRMDLPKLIQGLTHHQGIRLNYFLGKLGHWQLPHYYLVALPLKIPYPFLIGAGFGAWGLWSSNKRKQLAQLAIPALLFLLTISLAISLSQKYVVRYLFPIYPLLALLIASAWDWARQKGKKHALFMLLLALWNLGEAAWAFPHYLAYMNAPWRKQAHLYLANSDLDWGQDLPALNRFWEDAGKPALNLCYFGTASVQAWGLQAQEIPTVRGLPYSDWVLPLSPNKEFLAISAGCRQFMTLGMQDGRILKAWDWLDARKPLQVLGHTIFVYDIAQDVEAHGRIAQIHYFQGEYSKALREARRVLEIDPKDNLGRLLLKSIQKKITQDK